MAVFRPSSKSTLSSVGPEAGAQSFAADNFTRMFQQSGENLKGLVLQANRETFFEKSRLGKVQLELPKAYAGTASGRSFHPHAPPTSAKKCTTNRTPSHLRYFFRRRCKCLRR